MARDSRMCTGFVNLTVNDGHVPTVKPLQVDEHYGFSSGQLIGFVHRGYLLGLLEAVVAGVTTALHVDKLSTPRKSIIAASTSNATCNVVGFLLWVS